MIFLALEMYDGMLPFYGLVCGPKTIVVNVLGVQYISYQSSSTILVAVDRLRKDPVYHNIRTICQFTFTIEGRILTCYDFTFLANEGNLNTDFWRCGGVPYAMLVLVTVS